jgi:two-component system, LytTR family, response regulator
MNQTWRVLIVDDEPRARGLIRKMLRSAKEFEVVGECGNGYDAVDAVKKLKPDLMLLDVQMPEVDGFAVLERLRGEELPQVVFITAHDRYALKAFETNALDYLLKPFDEDRLLATLSRARDRLKLVASSEQNQAILSLLDNLKTTREYLERFVVRTRGRMLLLPVEEVDWIESEDKYVRLHTGNTSYLIRDTLTRLEGVLNPRHFLRVHRSTIVRLGFVREIFSDFHGDHRIVLRDGREIPLGRNYREHFFSTIEMR